MRNILRVLTKGIGILFLIAAFLQWITFSYPMANDWWPIGLIPGMFSQFLNWIIVCLLATAGWGIFTLGKFKLDHSIRNEKTDLD